MRNEPQLSKLDRTIIPFLYRDSRCNSTHFPGLLQFRAQEPRGDRSCSSLRRKLYRKDLTLRKAMTWKHLKQNDASLSWTENP